MKTYDNGSFYTVTFTSDDARAFSDNWPCSTVRGKGSFQFQKSNGDLVDATGSALRGDGSDWLAFCQDCQKFGEKALAARKECTFDLEYTDTFGGEANYSWVNRHELTAPANISDRALVRRAKAWAGLTGIPCRVDNYGDQISIYPRGMCTVLFISARY